MYARKLENKRESQILTITTHCMTDHSEENGYKCHISEAWKWSEVTQSCPTLCDPVDCSPPGSSVHGILQVRIPEWVAISFSRGSSRSRDWTQVSFVAGRRFNLWATREVSFTFRVIIDNTPCKKLPIVGNVLLVILIQANFLLFELSLGNLV